MRVRRAVMAVVGASVLAGVVLDVAGPLLGGPPPPPKALAAEAPGVGIVTFSRGDGGVVSKGIEDAFVRPMTKAASDEPVDFAWARLDVDGDGYDELVLTLTSKERCGKDGCPVIVMRKKQDGAWKAVLATVADQVRYRKDAPRRSLRLTLRTSQGDSDWTWDDGAGQFVPAGSAVSSADGGR